MPVIFENKHLSLLIGLEAGYLSKFSKSTKQFYRSFEIPKRRQGTRVITSPYPLLASCQSWIYENILKEAKLHERCFGFVKGRSVLDNANLHVGAHSVLNIDIRDFFGSIQSERVIQVFRNFGYSNRLSFFLASLCCYDKTLPQGACTSPMLSNIIAKRLDRRLFGLSNKMNLNYSRYADDITFSGDTIPNNVLTIIVKILREEGFTLNASKTRFKTGDCKKIVTGLSVGSGKVRVKKSYKRDFRKDCHYVVKNGLNELKRSSGYFDPLYIDRLIGKANFILYIEPDNNYARTALDHLKEFKLNNFLTKNNES